MQVVEVDTAGSLEDLRPEWEDLWNRDHAAGPFQHPDWALAWRRRLCSGRPWAIAAYQDGRMQALLPLYIHVDPADHERQATLIGNGAGDRLDLIMAERAEAARSAVLERLTDLRGAVWDRCDFRDLPVNAHLLDLVAMTGRATLDCDEPTPVLDLGAIPGDLSGAPRRRLLANLRTARRRAERAGRLSFETANGDTLEAAFDAFVDLHAARWRERGEPGALSDPAVQAFQRDAARAFARRGWLRLHLLKLDGEPVAAIFGFQLRRRAYHYLGGFDPAHGAFSPGGLILEYAVRQAVGQRASTFDFLRGREAYKYAWGAVDMPQHRLRLRSAAPYEPRAAGDSRRDALVR